MQIKQGMIVKSIAGHDKGSFYLIVQLDEKGAKIVDGRRRKLQKPKNKNILHLRATSKIVNIEDYLTDKSVRGLLHSYNFPQTNSR